MRLPRLTTVPVLLLAFAAAPRARAADDLLDSTQLLQLETKAEHAAVKEQCFLYTELVRNYTAIAGRQLAEGETEKANATLKRVQGYAAHIHVVLAHDTSKLKNAELLIHAAARNLGECLHHASSEDKAVMEATLKQLDKINDELLAEVFAH